MRTTTEGDAERCEAERAGDRNEPLALRLQDEANRIEFRGQVAIARLERRAATVRPWPDDRR